MTHLSSEQISEWTLGERQAEVSRHLESCSTCREEVLGLQEGLLAFRQSTHAWADRARNVVAPGMPSRRVASSASWTWAAATLVTVSIGLGSVYLNNRQALTAAQRAQDSLLLNQVHERLQRTVPQSMEPLMELMNEGKEDQK